MEGGRAFGEVLEVYRVLHVDIGTSKSHQSHSTLVIPRFDSCRAVVYGQIGNLERHYLHLICSLSDRFCSVVIGLTSSPQARGFEPPTSDSNAWCWPHVEGAQETLDVCQPRLKPRPLPAMEGESWYNSFVPRVVKKEEPPKQHRRRESLLRQPNVSPPPAAWVRQSDIDKSAVGE